MAKEVIRAPGFMRSLKHLSKDYLERVEKLIIKILQNPEIGKPMRFGRKGTREVYLSPFRLSYSYDEAEDVLYLLEVYHKKEQ